MNDYSNRSMDIVKNHKTRNKPSKEVIILATKLFTKLQHVRQRSDELLNDSKFENLRERIKKLKKHENSAEYHYNCMS
jgi:2-methylcitrate dehydratase PrpD